MSETKSKTEQTAIERRFNETLQRMVKLPPRTNESLKVGKKKRA